VHWVAVPKELRARRVNRAAGVLTGKHNSITTVPSGRFANNQMYLDRFWKETYLQLDACAAACAAAGISMTQAAFRWLKYHSVRAHLTDMTAASDDDDDDDDDDEHVGRQARHPYRYPW
jgi:hypothetical protein